MVVRLKADPTGDARRMQLGDWMQTVMTIGLACIRPLFFGGVRL